MNYIWQIVRETQDMKAVQMQELWVACILYFIHPDLEPLLCRTVGSIRVQETDLLTKTFESVLYTLYSLLPLLHLYGLLWFLYKCWDVGVFG